MFQRPHLQPLIKRMEEPRKFIQVLTGPRQVGKTTLITQMIGKSNVPYIFISADAVAASNESWLAGQWEIARLAIDQKNAGGLLLIIDEIQKIDNWSEIVKLLWDEDTRRKINIKVILLGSSRLLLQQGLTESLTGRFETTYMGHWSYDEMHQAFGWNVNEYVWFGGYPGSAELIKDEQRWKAYLQQSIIETSISKDILMLTRVDKPALMKRLFELGCLYSGQILSFTKMLGQLHDAGNTTTLTHYLQLLDTAGLLAGISKYSKTEIRKRASIPKFQVHNTALISGQDPRTFKEVLSQPAEWGRVVESAIGTHLINHSITAGFNLRYWREGNNEVDFVLERKGKIIALEVKSGSVGMMKGMNAFQKEFNPAKSLIIGDRGIPWEEFLKINPVDLF